MLGVGELGSTLYYKTGADQVEGVYESCPDDLVTRTTCLTRSVVVSKERGFCNGEL